MRNPIDAEHRRHDQLVAALIEPHGAEVHIAQLLSRWLSDREVGYLVGWVNRACDERTTALRDLLARVAATIGDATRDEHGNRIVTIGPTLTRHLFDTIQPPDGGTTSQPD